MVNTQVEELSSTSRDRLLAIVKNGIKSKADYQEIKALQANLRICQTDKQLSLSENRFKVSLFTKLTDGDNEAFKQYIFKEQPQLKLV